MDEKLLKKLAQGLDSNNPEAIKAYKNLQKVAQGNGEEAEKAKAIINKVNSYRTKKAAHGTKLNYFKSLKNQCAEDEEVTYFKKGGSVKCGCKKKEDGGEINKAEDGWKAKFKKRQEEQKRELEARKNIPNHAPGGSNKSNRFAAAQHFKDLKHKNDYKNNPEEKEPPTINKGYLKNKKGGEINKDCGGSAIAKFKAAKCGSKLKKHLQGGSLNGIPFMQNGTPKGGVYKPDWYKSIQAKQGVFDKNGDYYEIQTKRSLNGDTFTRRINTHYSQSPLISDTTYDYSPKQGTPNVISTRWLFDHNRKNYENLKNMFNKIVSIPVEKSPIDLMGK